MTTLTSASNLSPSTSGASSRLPKVTLPNPYDGNQDKLDDFLGQCQLYLTLCGDDYPDDLQKILFILSYMKEGTTAPWAVQQVNCLLTPSILPRPPIKLNDFLE